MSQKYYKVLNQNLCSARYGHCQYEINKWVTAPNDTRFFVFDNLYDARCFCNNYEVIWECQVIGGIKYRGALSGSDIKRFWNKFNKFLKQKRGFDKFDHNIKLSNIPAVLVTKVKLLQMVV